MCIRDRRYYTVNGPLPTIRETDPAPSRHVVEMVEAAQIEQAGVERIEAERIEGERVGVSR